MEFHIVHPNSAHLPDPAYPPLNPVVPPPQKNIKQSKQASKSKNNPKQNKATANRNNTKRKLIIILLLFLFCLSSTSLFVLVALEASLFHSLPFTPSALLANVHCNVSLVWFKATVLTGSSLNSFGYCSIGPVTSMPFSRS